MADSPLRNPGVSPSQEPKEIEPQIITPQEPSVLGGGLSQEQPKPFNLPEKGQNPTGTESSGQVSPMDLSNAQKQATSPQEISERIQVLNNHFGKLSQIVQNPNFKLKAETKNNLTNVMSGLNEDFRNMGRLTNAAYTPPKESNDLVSYLLNFLSSGQKQFDGALKYLGSIKNPNPADMLRLTYTVQRATQKTELFSTIISTGVSGIKTIMSTQLG